MLHKIVIRNWLFTNTYERSSSLYRTQVYPSRACAFNLRYVFDKILDYTKTIKILSCDWWHVWRIGTIRLVIFLTYCDDQLHLINKRKLNFNIFNFVPQVSPLWTYSDRTEKNHKIFHAISSDTFVSDHTQNNHLTLCNEPLAHLQ